MSPDVYIRAGFRPIPIPPGAKAPEVAGWPTRLFSAADFPSRSNVGLLLGVRGLADIDLDCPEARAIAPRLLPPSGFRFGRQSAPDSHFFYLSNPAAVSLRLSDPCDGQVLVELRGLKSDGTLGLQTVVPPSTHPSGEAIEFSAGVDFNLPLLSATDLRLAVYRIGAAALLARHWPKPKAGRNEAFMALAGTLARAGWTLADAIQFNFSVYEALWGAAASRSACESEVRPTFEKHAAGENVVARTRLCELIDKRAVDKACEWLSIQQEPAGAAAETDDQSAGAGDKKKAAERVQFPVCDLAKAIIAEGAVFARDAGGLLYVYRNGVYCPEGEEYVRALSKPVLNRLKKLAAWSSHKCAETAKFIAADCPVLLERPPRDIVNVQNGLLNVLTGELQPHTPEHLSPIQLPVRFDSEADCPGWQLFAESTFPEGTAALCFEVAAWLMTPDTSLQKAILATGEGANGKSRWLAAIVAFLGKQNCSAVSLHKLEQDRFSVSRLVGRLANICPDLPAQDLQSTSTFKALVGGDPMMAERKFADAFEFVPFARLVFSANHAPKSADASAAFFRRWIVIPFERTFTDGAGLIPADELDAILSRPDELSGVLNRALLALREIRRRGGLLETERTRRAADEFRQATDPMAVWLDVETVLDPHSSIHSDALYRAWVQACGSAGRPIMPKETFGRVMRRLRPTLDYRQVSDGSGDRPRHYIGIGWRHQ